MQLLLIRLQHKNKRKYYNFKKWIKLACVINKKRLNHKNKTNYCNLNTFNMNVTRKRKMIIAVTFPI